MGVLISKVEVGVLSCEVCSVGLLAITELPCLLRGVWKVLPSSATQILVENCGPWWGHLGAHRVSGGTGGPAHPQALLWLEVRVWCSCGPASIAHPNENGG